MFRLRCRWFDKHSDEIYFVGHNIGKECTYCKRHGRLTPEDIAMMQLSEGGEDEVAMESPSE